MMGVSPSSVSPPWSVLCEVEVFSAVFPLLEKDAGECLDRRFSPSGCPMVIMRC